MFTCLYLFIKECITSPSPLSSDGEGGEVLQIPSFSPWLVFWPLVCVREPPGFTSLEQGMLLVLSVGLVLRFFFFPFGCGSFLNSLLNLLQCYLCFLFWSFGYKPCEIPPPAIKPSPPALEEKVLPAGPPGKAHA